MLDGVLSSHSIGDTISHWTDSILHHKYLHRLHECRVIFIQHRKTEARSKHEYLQVTIQYRTHLRYIRIDRSFHRNPKDTQSHFRTLLRGGSLPADDTIFITTRPYDADSFSLYTMRFDHPVAPTILDLATVLQAVNSLSTVYNLHSMCYWHSRVVFDGMLDVFSGKAEVAQKPRQRGKFSNSIKLVEKGGRLVLGVWELPWMANSVRLPTRLEVLDEVVRLRGGEETEGNVAELDAGRAEVTLAVQTEKVRSDNHLKDSSVLTCFPRIRSQKFCPHTKCLMLATAYMSSYPGQTSLSLVCPAFL